MKYIWITPTFPDRAMLVIAADGDMWMARCHHEPEGRAIAELLGQRNVADEYDVITLSEVRSLPKAMPVIRMATEDEISRYRDWISFEWGCELGSHVPITLWPDMILETLMNADFYGKSYSVEEFTAMVASLKTKLDGYVPLVASFVPELPDVVELGADES